MTSPSVAGGSAADEPVYREGVYGDYATMESRHFWFRERTRLILWAIERYLMPRGRSFCDVGCGTGHLLRAVEDRFPSLQTAGFDFLPEALEFARARVRRAALGVADLRAFPYMDAWDGVGAFDVIEHISDDRGALAALHRALKPGGILFLAVPQHPFLWSWFDEIGFHKRRYRRGELAAKVRAAGFRVLRTTSFNSFLLPAAWLGRRRRPADSRAGLGLDIGPAVNAAGGEVMRAERLLIQAGFSFPVGVSGLLVAEKI